MSLDLARLNPPKGRPILRQKGVESRRNLVYNREEKHVRLQRHRAWERGERMKLLILDGQGGGIGKQLVSAVKAGMSGVEITAVGTNVAATTAMLKAGADKAATGENAVLVNCRRADVIVGPIGIVIADSLLGEITPAMATAVAQSAAKRILIPVNHCDTLVVGVQSLNTAGLIQDVLHELIKLQSQQNEK